MQSFGQLPLFSQIMFCGICMAPGKGSLSNSAGPLRTSTAQTVSGRVFRWYRKGKPRVREGDANPGPGDRDRLGAGMN